MLTLDPTTLFYWNLSDHTTRKRPHGVAVEEWAQRVQKSTKNVSTSRPTSRASSSHGTAKSRLSSVCSGLTMPSMTSGTSHLSTSTSILTNDLVITSALQRLNEGGVTIMESQGLPDIDKTIGEERDATVMSPPKGEIRISSKVSNFIHVMIF